jgi:hypothetical protein
MELRMLAALSGEPKLCQGYREEKDVHAITARLLLGLPEDAPVSFAFALLVQPPVGAPVNDVFACTELISAPVAYTYQFMSSFHLIFV